MVSEEVAFDAFEYPLSMEVLIQHGSLRCAGVRPREHPSLCAAGQARSPELSKCINRLKAGGEVRSA